MSVAVPATETTDDDAFGATFASLTNMESGRPDAEPVSVAASPADPADVVDPVAATPADPAAASPADPLSAGVEPTRTDGDAAPTSVDVVDPPAKPVDNSANDDMLRRIAALVKDKEPTPLAQPKVAVPAEVFTDEEKQILAAYDKDWPDQSRAEQIRVKAAVREAVGHVFAEVAKELQPLMATVQELAERESSRIQLGKLEAAEPDYASLRDNVIAWAAKQPAYLQPAYNHIIGQGTAEEIGEMIRHYKQAVGSAAPGPAPAVSAPITLAPAVKKAAAGLAPVRSIRSTPPAAGVDQNDFDGMFKQIADAERAARQAK